MSKPEYTHQCRYCAYCVFTIDDDYWCDEKNEYIAAPKRPNRCAAFLFNAIPADNPGGKPYRMLEFGTPRASFDHWLDTGMTIKGDRNAEDEPCLFAGTGFSESDGAEGDD